MYCHYVALNIGTRQRKELLIKAVTADKYSPAALYSAVFQHRFHIDDKMFYSTQETSPQKGRILSLLVLYQAAQATKRFIQYPGGFHKN